MKIAILSDIHANLGALRAVLHHLEATYGPELPFLQLGDLVSYGPHPDEVVAALRSLTRAGRVRVNLAGNHEAALLGRGADRFATARGVAALEATRAALSEAGHEFIRSGLAHEPVALEIEGRRVLCVHGSLADPLWGGLRGDELSAPAYGRFDVVFCGHTHVPLCYEEFFPADDPVRRNRRKTVFINPGSVGQPRNHDPRAHYAVWDPGADEFRFHRVPYDVAAEQAGYGAGADPFYRERLAIGI